MNLSGLDVSRRLIGFVVILAAGAGFFSHPVQATHIVGGEMTYRCLGNDQYEIRLVVFRDCYNGVPYFDTSVAYVGIYHDDLLIDSLYMPFRMVDDTLSPMLNDSCLVVPPNVCVHTTYYLDTVELAPKPGGYTLAYQRCCRNYTISNIVDPDDTGATYSIHITEAAMAVCNNSPLFNNWPPVYICADKPLLFDHSATDADGDSLVYTLCAPFDGATDFDPRPIPSNQTVPQPVMWLPPYGLDNVMGGDPLVIDSLTGIMTAVPSTIGQFVVGVCMEEYRDGQLLSVTRRDFQYNVGICGEPVSAFFIPDTVCGLEIEVEDQSLNADEWLWYFDGIGNLQASSTEQSPEYTYPDSGLYEVALIINPGSVCTDTFVKSVQVWPQTLNANFFIPPFPSCNDSIQIVAKNTSWDTQVDIVSFFWELNIFPFNLVATDTTTDFAYLFTDFDETILLKLVAVSERGCRDSILRIAQVDAFTALPEQDTISACAGEIVGLNPDGNPQYLYGWSPETLLDNPSTSNPVFSSPDTPALITFTATISRFDTSFIGGGTISKIDTCTVSRQVTVRIGLPLPVTLADTVVVCDDQPLDINATSPGAVAFEWAESPSFDAVLATNQTYTALVDQGTERWLFVRVDHGNGCVSIDSILVINGGFQLEGQPSLSVCQGDTLTLTAQAVPNQDSLQWMWEDNPDVLSRLDSSDILVLTTEDALYKVSAANGLGCETSAVIEVLIADADPDLVAVATPDTIFIGESVQLAAQTGIADVIFEWMPSQSLNFFDIPNPIATPEQTTTYQVTMTTPEGCVVIRTVTVVVLDAPCEEPYVFFPNVFSPNGDGENDELRVYGNFLDEVYFAIYNRWGENVFEAFSAEESWDGTWRGQPLSPDVFGYILRVRCLDGQEYTRKGNVTLLR